MISEGNPRWSVNTGGGGGEGMADNLDVIRRTGGEMTADMGQKDSYG